MALIALARVALLLLQILPPSFLDAITNLLLNTPDQNELQWRACRDHYDDSQYQCATFLVPKDYFASQNHEFVSIAVQKYSANIKKSRGVIIVSAGIVGKAIASAEMAELLGHNYDIIAFDFRGTGDSHPLSCPATIQLNLWPATLDKAIHAMQPSIKQCMDDNGDTIKYMSTATAARDLESIRKALDLRLLNFYGLSHGAYLGAVYANMFPDNIGKMILDSVPSHYFTSNGHSTVNEAINTSVNAFMNECRTIGPGGCALASYFNTSNSVISLTQTMNERQQVAIAMAKPRTWPHLAMALAVKRARQAPWSISVAQLVYLANDQSPMYWNWCDISKSWDSIIYPSSDLLLIAGVKSLSITPTERFMGPWNQTFKNSILIFNNEVDPISSVKNAKYVHTLLGAHQSILILRQGFGHGSISSQPSDCIHSILTAFYSNTSYSTTYCLVNSHPFQLQVEQLLDSKVLAMNAIESLLTPSS